MASILSSAPKLDGYSKISDAARKNSLFGSNTCLYREKYSISRAIYSPLASGFPECAS
jgi:hypothetical protein